MNPLSQVSNDRYEDEYLRNFVTNAVNQHRMPQAPVPDYMISSAYHPTLQNCTHPEIQAAYNAAVARGRNEATLFCTNNRDLFSIAMLEENRVVLSADELYTRLRAENEFLRWNNFEFLGRVAGLEEQVVEFKNSQAMRDFKAETVKAFKTYQDFNEGRQAQQAQELETLRHQVAALKNLVTTQANEFDAQVAALHQDHDHQRMDLEASQRQIAEDFNDLTRATVRIASYEEEVARLKQQIESNEARIQQLLAEIKALQSDLSV